MANREITYYSLLSSQNLGQIESVADKMEEQSFVTLGFEEKWIDHLWISNNNVAFLEYLSQQTDLKKLDKILGEQLKLYARKQGDGYEKGKDDLHRSYEARKDWINHTIFICKNEYSQSQNEVFNEVVKWCIEWQNEWLETFNPYSPNELQEMDKELKTALWEKLNDTLPQATKSDNTRLNETQLSEKIKKHFGFFNRNCPRKGIPILNNKKDFDNLVKWTTFFYENNFEVPEISEPIKSVNTNDYFTQLAFLYLFDELRKSGYHNQRTRAKTLFNLWECCFTDYKGYSEKNFWKVKRENGNEVKKLMLMD